MSISITITTILLSAVICMCTTHSFAADREIDITGKYLNFPVPEEADKCLISLIIHGEKVREFVINMAPGEPEDDYWVYLEVQDFVGLGND